MALFAYLQHPTAVLQMPVSVTSKETIFHLHILTAEPSKAITRLTIV